MGPEAALVSFPDYQAAEQWSRATVLRATPGLADDFTWSSRETVWGDTGAVDAFVALANDAGASLPIELTFTLPLFTSFNFLGNLNPDRRQWWMEFLFLICPTVFKLQPDTPAPGSRVARLAGSPFLVTVNAIDRLLAADAPTFLRAFREGAARFNPWFGEEDCAAALAAIEASSRRGATPTPGAAPRAVHWTDFPERIEKFGDLFSIFEPFERDLSADLIHSGSCEKETDESAYTVEFMGVNLILPRPDRILGWEQLTTCVERRSGSEVTLDALRVIRGFVSEVQDVPTTAVNEMTIVQVVEVLNEARRQPVGSAAGADPLLDEFRFLKVKQIVDLFALSASQVSKLADSGTFASNGKTGHDRRIDVLSVVKWVLNRLNREKSVGADTSG